MATNRFEGSIVSLTSGDKREAQYSGIGAGKLEALDVTGLLSESGLGSDTDAGEDYSSTATFFSFKATAESVIYKVVLSLESGDVDETAAKDIALFLGGASALTNGIIFGVASSAGTPDLFADTTAKTLAQLVQFTGGELVRDTNLESATNTVNHDHVFLTIDFVKNYGVPLKLAKNELVGFYLQDDLSGLSSVHGAVFGRLI